MNCENGFHVYCHMYIHFGNRTRGISHCGPKIRWSFTNHHPVSGGMNYKKPPQNQNCKQLSKSMGRKWVKRAISYNKRGIKVVLNDCRLHRSLCSSAGRIWCWMSVLNNHSWNENHARCWRWDKNTNHYTTLSLKLDEEISKFVTSSFVIFVFGITRGLGCSSCHLFQMISLDSTAATMNLYFHYFIRKHEGQQYKLRSKITLIKSSLSLK